MGNTGTVWVTSGAWASSQEDRGLSIFVESDRRDTGFDDFTADLVMILKNRHGNESRRIIRTKTLEGKNDADKTMIIFDNPRDVKGTALLTYTRKKRNDDQWLYLPALKSVKWISSDNRSGSFMGSEMGQSISYIWDERRKRYFRNTMENSNSRDLFALWKVIFMDFPIPKRPIWTYLEI